MSFDYNQYKLNIARFIKDKFTKPVNEKLSFDIFESDDHKNDRQLELKTKHRQILRGHILQEALGSYNEFKNLGTGKHKSGLDIISDSRKIVMELKSRTNTDNSTSRKGNMTKLAKFKEQYPEYMCIYAQINPPTERAFYSTIPKIIKHDGFEIYEYTGFEIFKLVFGDKANEMLDFIKQELSKY